MYCFLFTNHFSTIPSFLFLPPIETTGVQKNDFCIITTGKSITRATLFAMTIVQMTKDEIDVFSTIALKRWLAKWGSQDQPNYAKGKSEGRLEHEITANVRTILSEWAVAREYNFVMNVPWYPNSLHSQRGRLPDVGGNIEVRSARTRDCIAVWSKDEGKVIFGVRCLDPDFFSEFEILGAISFDEVVLHPEWQDSQFGGWAVPLHALKSYPQA